MLYNDGERYDVTFRATYRANGNGFPYFELDDNDNVVYLEGMRIIDVELAKEPLPTKEFTVIDLTADSGRVYRSVLLNGVWDNGKTTFKPNELDGWTWTLVREGIE